MREREREREREGEREREREREKEREEMVVGCESGVFPGMSDLGSIGSDLPYKVQINHFLISYFSAFSAKMY